MILTVRELIEEDWSPEQISEWCKMEEIEMVFHVYLEPKILLFSCVIS